MKMSQRIGKIIPEFPVQPDETRPDPHTSIGVEVELERVNITTSELSEYKYWVCTHDGSLRNGIELVSLPVWGTAINDAIIELDHFFSNHNPYISSRTSVHVHVNILDLTAQQLINFIKCAIIYEKSLFTLHEDQNRYDNVFCIPCKKSLVLQKCFGELLNFLPNASGQVPSFMPSKYSACNTNCIGSFGTVEFRHMGGTNNTTKLVDWIDILLSMKNCARREADIFNPQEVFGGRLEVRPMDIKQGRDTLENILTYSQPG